MSINFVKDPRTVVKAGDVVKVKVLEVDLKRKRIALTMRLNDDSREYIPPSKRETPGRQRPAKTESEGQTTLAEAFARARRS